MIQTILEQDIGLDTGYYVTRDKPDAELPNRIWQPKKIKNKYCQRFSKACKEIRGYNTFDIDEKMIMLISDKYEVCYKKIIKVLEWEQGKSLTRIGKGITSSIYYDGDDEHNREGLDSALNAMGVTYRSVFQLPIIAPENVARREGIYYLMRTQGFRNKDTATIFKKIPSAVSFGIKRFESELQKGSEEHIEIWDLINNFKITTK